MSLGAPIALGGGRVQLPLLDGQITWVRHASHRDDMPRTFEIDDELAVLERSA